MARRWRLIAAAAVGLLALGCGADREEPWPSGTCRTAEELVTPGDKVTVKSAAEAMLTTARNLKASTGTDITATYPPDALSGREEVKVGQLASWEVAVLQLPDRPRRLQTDFGDGGPLSVDDVPAGSGVCLFRVSRTFRVASPGHAVRFTIVDPSAAGDSPPQAQPGEAVIDVLG